MKELRGSLAADLIKNECLDYVGKFNGALPALAIIRLGVRPEDLSYERSVRKRFMDFGLEMKDYEAPENVSQDELEKMLDFLNRDPEVNGILLMRPLPKGIDQDRLLQKLSPEKDLDGITKENLAGLLLGREQAFAPCTAEAVVTLLKSYQIPLEGKHAVIVGRSDVVGKPLSLLLLRENCTVTVCHSKTENLKEMTSQADILVTAVGRPRFFGPEYVKEDAVVVDVGINTDKDGMICGDCDFDAVSQKAAAVSPVPGGLGVVTTAVLARHLVQAAKRQMAFHEVPDDQDGYLEP